MVLLSPACGMESRRSLAWGIVRVQASAWCPSRGIPLKIDGVLVLFGPEQDLWLQHDLRQAVVSSQVFRAESFAASFKKAGGVGFAARALSSFRTSKWSTLKSGASRGLGSYAFVLLSSRMLPGEL